MTSVKIIGVNLKPSSYSGFALMSSIIVKCIEMSATGIRVLGKGFFWVAAQDRTWHFSTLCTAVEGLEM